MRRSGRPCPLPHRPRARLDLHPWGRTESIILSYVRGVMCSGVWEQSMRCEIERYDAKKRVLMGKALKAFKSAHPGEMPVVPDIACVMLSAMAGTRLVRMVDMQEREYLSTTCTGCILKHVALLNRMCDGVITECRLKSTTIGMLYLMRQGVVMHGVVVLPKIDRLQHVLPVESHLKSMFGIRGKCITETENIVKVVLRSASRADLESYGVATVENRLVGGSGEAAWGPGWPPAAAPARI